MSKCGLRNKVYRTQGRVCIGMESKHIEGIGTHRRVGSEQVIGK